MEITCKQCSAKFRAVVELPLRQAVRLLCPSCGKSMVLKPTVAPDGSALPETPAARALSSSQKRRAVIADEPRAFRTFLVRELTDLGFEVRTFENGDEALATVRATRAELVILNVYLKGKLGVEISEEIKADPALVHTKVVLIGALFRANRFRANPTNLYGADEYIEEQIPAKELHQIVHDLFPGAREAAPSVESKDADEARRLARLILSDIIIYNAEKVEQAIRDDNFFDVLEAEIKEGRDYYDSRVPFQVRQTTEFFSETLQQFVQMKREELRARSGGR
jgi:response regulator RpfG family c-di-GMP phosphodiesterase